MPDALLSIARRSYVRQSAKAVEEPSAPEDQLQQLLTLVRVSPRQDFTSYRKRTVLRRIERAGTL